MYIMEQGGITEFSKEFHKTNEAAISDVIDMRFYRFD